MEITLDGRTVFISESGEWLASPLLLIHGAGGGHQVWKGQIPALTGAGHRCLAVDLPGHGRSQGPALDRVELIADWLLALMDALGLQRTAVAGHSLGSQVALEAAARAPGRIDAIALLAIADSMPVNERLLGLAKTDSPAAIGLIKSWAVAGELDAVTWNLLFQGADRLFADLSAAGSYGGALASAARLSCPTLLILGAEDRMTPSAAGEKLAAAITGARTRILKECGHMLMAEQPQQVNRALTQFF